MVGLLRIFVCASVLPAVIYIPMILLRADMGQLLYWFILLLVFLGAPWTLLWTGGWKVGLAALAALSLSLVTSLALLIKSHALSTAIRWTFLSVTYKNEVLTQAKPSPGKLQHIDWDSWGFVPAGSTYTYLVHDPNDRLRAAMHTRYGLRAEHLSCEVADIHRLEKAWYVVTLPTDTGSDSC